MRQPRKATATTNSVQVKHLALVCLTALVLCGCGDPKQASQDRVQTDLVAHPGYQADMEGLVLHLSSSNIEAVWPGGYGGMVNSDTIMVSLPPSNRDAEGAILASRVYDKMTAVRLKDGYGDQAGSCFVHVLNNSGQEVAVDRMGQIR